MTSEMSATDRQGLVGAHSDATTQAARADRVQEYAEPGAGLPDEKILAETEAHYRRRLETESAPDFADPRTRSELVCAAHGGPMGQGPEECHICDLLAAGVWDCEVCGGEVIGLKSDPAICGNRRCDLAIEQRIRRDLERQKDRATVLAGAKVPELYGGDFDLGRVQHQEQPSPASRQAGQQPAWPSSGGRPMNRWKGDPSCVLITGPTGVGKSALAAEILYKIMRAGRTPGFWVTMGDLVNEQREISLGAAGPLIRSSREATALVLDEIGAGHRFTADLQFLLTLVEYRVSRMMPTIFTSHVALGDLDEISRAILSRAGSGIVLELDGTDQRGRRP